MPTNKRTPEPMPSPELVLAAIERAERHQRSDKRGVSRATIKEHLGLARGSWSTRQLRPTWDALQTDGLIEEVRRSGIVMWALTAEGRARLEVIHGDIGPLPESPQHKRWREGRREAGQRIGEFRDEMGQALDDATQLLDTDEQASSKEWFELGRRLERLCGVVASATYCLAEWAEPDDSRADLDEAPYGQGARRETRGWNLR